MNRFELWDKVARNWQYRWQQPFRSVVALCIQYKTIRLLCLTACNVGYVNIKRFNGKIQ